VLASVLAALAGIELALRIADYKPVLQSGWLLGSSTRTLDDDLIVIPSRFLRPSFYERRPGTRAIVTLGDSFTEGYPVDGEDAYPAVLERMLTKEGLAVQVFNAGFGDSGPDQQLKLFERDLLPRLRPEVVVWSFYVNDLWDNVLKAVYDIDGNRLVPLPATHNWMYLRQLLYNHVPLPRSMKNHSYAFQVLLGATDALYRWQIPAPYRGREIDWGADKLRLEIDAMNALATARGFRVYYVLVTPESLYLAGAEPEKWRGHWSIAPYATLDALLREQPVIAARFDATSPTEIFADPTRDLAPPGDHHLNEVGYRLLAETVTRRLLRDGLGKADGRLAP